MIVSGITKHEINQALAMTNKVFDGNVIINNYSCLNTKGTRHRVTLRVRDSTKAGHRLGQCLTSKGNHRRLVSACWHVYGHFIDNLFGVVREADNVKVSDIRTGKMVCWDEWHWQDWNIGSDYNPLYYSEACDCEVGWNLPSKYDPEIR